MFIDSNSHYKGNTADTEGGVMHLYKVILKLTESILLFNSAQDSGGAVSVHFGTLHFYKCEIFGNIAGQGVLRVQDAHIYMNSTIFYNNAGMLGVIYLIESTCIVSGFSEFTTNIGSIFTYNSNITITGNATFIKLNSYPSSTNHTYIEGGVITAFQSTIILSGICKFEYNFAESGGAVYATESQVYITGNATLSHNTAEKNGGAIFLYQSRLKCLDNGKLLLLGNIAGERGGAIHAISSSIRTSNILKTFNEYSCISQIIFTENYAIKGGAVSMQSYIS